MGTDGTRSGTRLGTEAALGASLRRDPVAGRGQERRGRRGAEDTDRDETGEEGGGDAAPVGGGHPQGPESGRGGGVRGRRLGATRGEGGSGGGGDRPHRMRVIEVGLDRQLGGLTIEHLGLEPEDLAGPVSNEADLHDGWFSFAAPPVGGGPCTSPPRTRVGTDQGWRGGGRGLRSTPPEPLNGGQPTDRLRPVAC